MEGVVKSFVAEKRFGFIDGADGKSYFFHVEGFTPRLDAGVTLDGALVSFDPTPTPKGLSAKRLRLARDQAVEWVPPNEFIFSKESGPKQSRIVVELPAVRASGDDSPDNVKAELRRIAANMGANAVIGVEYSKTTGRSGNYRYSIHNITGRPAIVMLPRMTCDLAAVTASERKCEEMAVALEDGHAKYLAHLAELERQARARRRVVGLCALAAFCLVIYLIVR